MIFTRRRSHRITLEKISLSILLSLFSIGVFAQQGAGTPAAGLGAEEQAAAARLESKTIREVTTMLASKEMEGRGTAQSGADRAAEYLAGKFAELGLKAGGDANTYLQGVKFISELDSPESSFKARETTFKYKEDFLTPTFLTTESKDVSGNLVFAGYGVVSDKLSRDDLRGIDVNGKIVMLLVGKPSNIDDNTWAKNTTGQPFASLGLKGASGIVLVWKESPASPFLTAGKHPRRRRVRLAESPAVSSKVPPQIIISEQMAEKLFAGQDITFAKARQMAEAGEWVSRDLNTQVSFSARYKREEKTSSNVVAVLEGSDPKLKEQAVVITAHYDGYGIAADGTIYPGAADNALGVGKLLAIAEALKKAKVRLRRSIIFIALTGEEYGLLGAQHWAKYPTWPMDKVAANINYDGIGTDAWGPLGIIVDYNFNHSDLGGVIKEVSAANGINIMPDPLPQEGAFYRSDHYVFAVKGVPALYLQGAPKADNIFEFLKRVNNWLANDYHMPTDVIKPDWNWEGARTFAILGLITGMRVANQETMPAWRTDSPYNRPRGNNLPPPPR